MIAFGVRRRVESGNVTCWYSIVESGFSTQQGGLVTVTKNTAVSLHQPEAPMLIAEAR